MAKFQFPHSHAFNGGSVRVADDGKTGTDCLVEFGDGVTVIARCRFGDEAIDLEIPDYRTARGTTVDARNWRVAQRQDGTWRSLRRS